MKKKYLAGAVLLFFPVISFSLIAKADDDHHERERYELGEYRIHENYDDDDHDEVEEYDNGDFYEHDEDEDDEYENFYNNDPTPIPTTKEYWYKWSRSATEPTEIANLPITKESELVIKGGKEATIKLTAIPLGSQLLVPIKETATYLGAKTTIYPKSEILEINKDKKQLIVKINSKVVYENMRKAPMQAKVQKINEKYYLPLSVLANGLGYEINENVKNNQIQLERIVEL